MKTASKTLLALCLAASFAPVAQAEKFFGTSSISVLHSGDYQAFGREEVEQTYFTFENATGHNWGTTFFFMDRHQAQGTAEGDDGIYGEFSPTLSLGWLTGQDLKFGPVKDVFLAATYEFGGGTEANNYLGGMGLSWDVPGMLYFNTVLFYADNSETTDDLQFTLTWATPFDLGPAKFLFDGYIDWSTAESDHESDFHFNPQLKLDVGHFMGAPGVLYAGIEYSYWNNKYGLGDAVMDTENTVSALVKFHF